MQGLDISCQECTEVQKNWRGCYGEVQETEFVIDGIPLKRCPLKLMTPETIEYVHYFNFFEKGFLPNPGSILDQPNKYTEMIITIQGFTAKKEREERKEQKQNRGGIR